MFFRRTWQATAASRTLCGDILIATPQRLVDAVGAKRVDMSAVMLLVRSAAFRAVPLSMSAADARVNYMIRTGAALG
jgi:hypothetical protein